MIAQRIINNEYNFKKNLRLQNYYEHYVIYFV